MNELDRFNGLPPETQTYVQNLYGGFPPSSQALCASLIHTLTLPTHRYQTWCVTSHTPVWLQWHLHLCLPLQPHLDPGSLLLSPDGCWPHVVNPEAMHAVLSQGVCWAYFDRLLMAHDRDDGVRAGALYKQEHAAPWGTIAAWAWGIEHSVKALQAMEEFHSFKFGVIGHSRGGKAALLAGALQPAIDLTISHNSGCAGAASWQVSEPGAETLAQLLSSYPHWLSYECRSRKIQEELFELDNLALLIGFTGRHLCVMQAEDDPWANPNGTRHAVQKLESQWRPQGLSSHLTLHTRQGGHAMTRSDWSRAASTLAHLSSIKK